MDYPFIKLGVLFFLFLFSGFFSCSEATFFSLTSLHLHKIEKEQPLFSGYVRYLLQYPRRLLITIIVGNEIVNASISVVATALFLHFLGSGGQIPAIAATTVALLIFGEAVPKTVGMSHPLKLSPLFAPFLMILTTLERPIVWLLERLSALLTGLLPQSASLKRNAITEEEFKTLIETGRQEGALEESQRDLIHRVFELGDKPVSEVMIPRVDMFCLPLSLGIEKMKREIINARHSRIPIYGADRDDVLGIIFAHDILSLKGEGDQTLSVTRLLKKPYFVPLEKSAGSLLRELKIRRLPLAIVVDEFGGVSGMVTTEDILEHLFIDVYDEYGIREHLWQRLDDRTMIMSGKIPIQELNEITDMEIPLEDFETLGGFVFHLFGKLPAKGEKVSFGSHTLQVEKMVGKRIVTIKVQKEEQDG